MLSFKKQTTSDILASFQKVKDQLSERLQTIAVERAAIQVQQTKLQEDDAQYDAEAAQAEQALSQISKII